MFFVPPFAALIAFSRRWLADLNCPTKEFQQNQQAVRRRKREDENPTEARSCTTVAEEHEAEEKDTANRKTGGRTPLGQCFLCAKRKTMFSFYAEQWFSLFKRGIKLLADMSTLHSTTGLPHKAEKRFSPKKPQLGNGPRNVYFQEAKAAFQRGHGVPRTLGKASHKTWARRPTEPGHGVQNGFTRNITDLGTKMVTTFFPQANDKLGPQARAASEWVKSRGDWQWLPWYAPILASLQPQRHHQKGSKWPILSKASSQLAMVAKQHQGPWCPKLNKPRCSSFLPSSFQPFKASLLQKFRGDKNGMGNHSGIPGSGCYKRNSLGTSKTSDPLVHHKKGGKAATDYQLQGNKSLLRSQTFQVGKLGRYFSLSQERHVGSQNRPQTCLFPFGTGRSPQTIHLHSGGRKSFPISGSMFWLKHPASTMAKCDESFSQKMEKARNFNMGLFRRHTFGGQQPSGSAKTFANHVTGFGQIRNGCKPKEVSIGANPTSGTFGFYSGFKERIFASATRKDEKHQERTWKDFDTLRDDLQKNGSHFGCHQKFSHGNAFFKGFHRPVGAICKPTRNTGMGQKNFNSPSFAGTSKRNELPHGNMERQNFSGQNPSQRTPFRFLSGGLGWSRCYDWKTSPGILERQKRFAHQCERIGSSNKHSAIFGTKEGTCPPEGGQFSNVCLLDKGGGKNPQFESDGQTIFKMVHAKTNIFDGAAGKKFRGFGRWPQQVVQGQRGLHHGQKFVPLSFAKNAAKKNISPSGHVCLPWQSSTRKICVQIPTLASNGSRCSEVPPKRHSLLLCKPSMVSDRQVAPQAQGAPSRNLHDDHTLLGFSCMVAPTNQTAVEGDPCFSHPPISRDVQELLGRIYASSQMAPDLHNVIREGLQSKQVNPEAANTYLKSLKSLPRYNRAFKLFWAFCKTHNMSTTSATLTEIASMMLQFDKLIPTHGRHAYAALLLVPGMAQLQFEPLLRQVKRVWNTSTARYVSFFNAKDPIERLAQMPLTWHSVEQIRLRLLLCCRFFMLCRNIDLERMFRKVAFIQEKPFILMQRKGCMKPQWEAMVTIPDVPALCPWFLLKKYVAMTAAYVKPGTPVFISLKAPFVPLKANTLGSLTKQSLSRLGVDTNVWKAHSTRGAGVAMYKSLGLSSEEVCEIGKWKNASAFTSHYLRLNATDKIGAKIYQMVHSVSPLQSAESDLTWTTGIGDPGGSVREDGAQSHGEPTPPPFGVVSPNISHAHLLSLADTLSNVNEAQSPEDVFPNASGTHGFFNTPDPFQDFPEMATSSHDHPMEGKSATHRVPGSTSGPSAAWLSAASPPLFIEEGKAQGR